MSDEQTKNTNTTNEKLVSLYPLDFKEAVAALLKVKPKTKRISKEKQNAQKET